MRLLASHYDGRPLSQGARNWRLMAQRRVDAGLTTRGTVPKRRLEGRFVLADIDAAAQSIADVYPFLPRTTQAKLLALSQRLAKVRKQCL